MMDGILIVMVLTIFALLPSIVADIGDDLRRRHISKQLEELRRMREAHNRPKPQDCNHD